MYYLWFLVCKKILSSFRGVIEKTQNSRILAPFLTPKSFFITQFFITNQKAVSFGGLNKGIMLLQKIFFSSMLIIDFLPHLYRLVMGDGPQKGPKNGNDRHLFEGIFFRQSTKKHFNFDF